MAANELPRAERRRISVGLIGRADEARRTGLPVPPDGDISIGLALALRRLLADKAGKSRATDAAQFAAAVLEATLVQQVANENLGCRQGCAWCCKSAVTCSAPEIFLVAGYVAKQGPDAVAEVVARAERHAGKTAEDLIREKLDCALLKDGACAVYNARPLACRQLFSLSSEACREAMEDGSENVPLLVEPMQLGEFVRTMLFAALRAEGMSEVAYDLSEGVARALTTEDAEVRWIAGEDVFAGVRSAVRPERADVSTGRITEVLRRLEY